MESEKNILDHLAILVRWRRMILLCMLTVSMITAGISLTLPEAFRAESLIYPPKESQGLGGLSSLIENLPMGLLGLSDGGQSATDFEPVLRSDRVAEAVARRFKLAERYGRATREELLNEIRGRLEVQLSREQFLSVSYEDETPELAAEITNAYVEELDFALQQRRREQAQSLRAYLDLRLREAEKDMFGAEQAYNKFQNDNMIIDLEAQARAQIESAGTILGPYAELIIKRDVFSRIMEPDNPQLRKLEIEIGATKDALDNLLMGDDSGEGDSPNGQFPEIVKPFRQVPELGLQVLRLMRDVEIQNAIYQFVRQEYEKSRFEEEKETPIVVVLDKAVEPDFRSSPRRTFMVLSAMGLSLVLSILLAFTFEAIQNLGEENRAKLDNILSELRGKS